ncbi:raftlin-like [Thalassophryne amazonica]|uniref:raftlin-like n=1 Tax=Thalassophryne amazonica TaxID=390379 RepID=UPI001471E9CE|nr:raftlin-like [Thalassophryne amazonica]
MGCGLRKIKPPSDDNSPGKIYSTLKRPQVETKVGIAYTYRYLDFLIGKEGGTSTLHLSSVRELPGQLQDMYQQGFILAAVHPFIHPCTPQSSSPQHQLYRAILVRLSDGEERSQTVRPYRLHLEDCLSAEQVPTPEFIQGYVKKQIQDAADQGVMFVGFVQEAYRNPCTRIGELDTPSFSLHSSPSSVLGSLGSSNLSSPRKYGDPGTQDNKVDHEAIEASCETAEGVLGEEKPNEKTDDRSGMRSEGVLDEPSPAALPISEEDLEHSAEVTEGDSLCHNNNKSRGTETQERPRYRVQRGDGVELLALYNHPPVREAQVKYYTVKVPLNVKNCEEGVKGVEANWLDHMTQHFNNGASLVDGYFHLGNLNDLLPKSVESVFVFQEASQGEPNAANPTYDAIVVEQWTIVDGLQVKADYVPLLQSLATYGWRLTCVLPTPVIKANSDGSLSTKQIVFLQRPILGRKRRDSKKLIFKPRNKSNKNCIKDTAKNKKKQKKTTNDKEVEDPKILDDREKEASETKSRDERVSTLCAGAAKGSEMEEEDRNPDGGNELSIETVEKKGGLAAVKREQEEEQVSQVQEGSKEIAKPSENGEVYNVTKITATVEKEAKDEQEEDAEEVQAVVENGLETDEENDEHEEGATKPLTEEPVSMDVIAKEIVSDSQT